MTCSTVAAAGARTVARAAVRARTATVARAAACARAGAPAGSAPALLAAVPVLAATGWRGSGLTVAQLLVLFVGVPVVMFAVLSLLLVVLPARITGSRYRPELSWAAEPVWFDGPDDRRQSVRVAEPTRNGGGASARW